MVSASLCSSGGKGKWGQAYNLHSSPNFASNPAKVYEACFFEGGVFVIAEHVRLSLEDVLQEPVCLPGPKMVYIIYYEPNESRPISVFIVSSSLLSFGRLRRSISINLSNAYVDGSRDGESLDSRDLGEIRAR
jgi:hypothetical protein